MADLARGGMLHLVRHAEASGHESGDPGLSALGREQASALAVRLQRHRVGAVWHGPRRRTTETARVLADHLGVGVEGTRSLDDRTVVPSAARRHEYPAHGHAWLDAVPDAERDEDGVALSAAWRELRERAGGDGVVLVTHAFVVSWFVTVALQAAPATWLRLPAANAGLTTFRTDSRGDLVLETFNATDHLPRPLPPANPHRPAVGG